MDSNLKIVGIIGGLSHESSDDYSKGIHVLVNKALGGLNNAELIQYDVNFAEIRKDMLGNQWGKIGHYLGDVAESLTMIGAQYVAVASDTAHKIAPDIEDCIGKDRFLHIADCIGQRCIREIDQKRALCPELYGPNEPKRVLLLGKMETMTGSFLHARLEGYKLAIYTPDRTNMKLLDNYVSNELYHNIILEETQKWYLGMIKDMLSQNPVDAIILGCTELSLLYDEFNLAHRLEVLEANGDRPFAVIDSKQAHIIGIAQACLGQWKGSD